MGYSRLSESQKQLKWETLEVDYKEQPLKMAEAIIQKPTPNSGEAEDFFLSVTLNLPRTLKFLRSTQAEQKEMYYYKWCAILKENRPIGWAIETHHRYEHCKNGQIHLHGYIKYKPSEKHYVSGFISDLVKTYKKCIGKKEHFNLKCYFPEYQRYRDASICIQIEENERREHWQLYIEKEQ